MRWIVVGFHYLYGSVWISLKHTCRSMGGNHLKGKSSVLAPVPSPNDSLCNTCAFGCSTWIISGCSRCGAGCYDCGTTGSRTCNHASSCTGVTTDCICTRGKLLLRLLTIREEWTIQLKAGQAFLDFVFKTHLQMETIDGTYKKQICFIVTL